MHHFGAEAGLPVLKKNIYRCIMVNDLNKDRHVAYLIWSLHIYDHKST
jgi:hypothetical protein